MEFKYSRDIITLYPPDPAPLAPAAGSAIPALANGNGHHSPYVGYANPHTPISVDSIGMGLVSQIRS